jgi:long-chain acyl-CoA synthetase
MTDDDTFPKLLLRNAARWPERQALREKEFGIWRPVTWRAYAEHVRDFALGLYALGVRRGDTVAIVGDNRPEWVYAELAAQSLGGVSVGLYQDAVADEVQYIIDHCDASVVVVEDQEQVDKLLEILPALPRVRHIIYYDPRGLRAYDEPTLRAFPAVEALGRELAAGQPGLYEREVARGAGADLAMLCYTSGTTGKPKGAMLSFANLLAMGRALMEVDPLQPGDDFVSFLPLAWIGEQMMALSCGMQVGFTINFPEEPETVQHNIREIAPHVMFSPPRIWENMVSQVQVKTEDASWLKRRMVAWALPVGERAAEAKFDRRALGGLDRLKYRLADLLVFGKLRDQLGLVRFRRCYTGGAALGPDVFRFFHAIGVNLKQIYGSTEICGIAVLHRDDDIRVETMGQPLPGNEVRITPEGEIWQRSPAVFQGYYKNPAATAESLVDGWLRTGDAGVLDERGHLTVIDRLKDVMRLVDGSTFSPQFIENKLKFSPYVREAVVFGGGRDRVAAMINIDFANVGKWAENHQLAYTTYTDLAAKPEVYDLIAAAVERVNRELPAAARVRTFVLLHKELDADDAELTRTRKVRRSFVESRYAGIIAALYSDAASVEVVSDITYQDGRTARIATSLPIRHTD